MNKKSKSSIDVWEEQVKLDNDIIKKKKVILDLKIMQLFSILGIFGGLVTLYLVPVAAAIFVIINVSVSLGMVAYTLINEYKVSVEIDELRKKL